MIGGAVDSRVVEMSFNNSNFEAGAKQSLSTLDRLKDALDFSKKAKSFEDVNNGIRSVNIAPLVNGIQQVQAHFSALEVVGMRVLTNITDRIMRMSEQFVRSLTMEPINQGFGEYELKMNSVQTIMASTGKDIDTVNKYLAELNTYADKTIYSFSDMTSSIGKFTNAGVDLDSAVKAIQGISNEAAVSGANANEASRAMYNFAQALSAGAVKLIDWKSIENANMATVEFKQSLMDTAVAMGTLKKDGDEYVSTTKDMQGKVSQAFSATHAFNESLSSQWMTTDVLIQTLGNYATDVREMSKDEKKAYEEKLASIGYTEEQIKAIEKLGQKAFDSAQDVKTFSQLMDTMKEAVGSSWSQIFETLFGNLEEAKKLWTNMGKELETIFVAPIDNFSATLNKAFESASKIEGKTSGQLWTESLTTAVEGMVALFKTASEAASNVFPSLSVDKVQTLIESVYNATVRFKDFAENSENLKRVLTGLFSGLDIVLQVFKSLGGGAISVVRSVLQGLGFDVGDTAGSVADLITQFDKWLKDSNILSDAVKQVSDFAGQAATKIREFIDVLRNSEEIQTVIRGLKEFKDAIKDVISSTPDFVKGLSDIISKWKETVDAGGGLTPDNFIANINSLFTSIGTYISNFKGFSSIKEAFEKVGQKIGEWAGKIWESFSKLRFKEGIQGTFLGDLITMIVNLGDGIKKAMSGVAKDLNGGEQKEFTSVFDVLSTIAGKIKEVIDKIGVLNIAKMAAKFLILKRIFDIIKNVITKQTLADKLKDTIGSIGGAFDALKDKLGGKDASKGPIQALKSIAISIGILVAALYILTKIDVADLQNALLAMTWIGAIVAALTYVFSKCNFKMGQGIGIMGAAIGIAIIAGVVKQLSAIPMDQLQNGIIATAMLGAIISALAYVFSKCKFKAGQGVGMMLIGVSLAILVGVVKMLGAIPMDQLQNGIIATAMLAAIISALAYVFSKCKFKAGQGLGMVLIGASLAILVGVVKMLGAIPLDQLQNGLVATALLAAIISALAYVFSKCKFKAGQGVGMILISASLAILVGVVKQLGELPLDQLQNGIIATGLLAAVISALAYVFSKCKFKAGQGVGMILISVAIGVLAGVVKALGQLDVGALTKGIVAVGLLGMVLAAITAMLSETKIPLGAIPGIILVTAAIAILAGVVGLLSGIDPSRLAVATLCLSALMGMFALLLAVGQLAKDVNPAIAIMLAVVIVLALVLNAVAEIPADRALAASLSLSVLLMSLSAAMLILSAVGAMGAAVYQGMAALAVFIAGFGAIAVALGALTDKFPQLELFLNKGIDILVKIGEGIGRFFGALIGGFSDQVLSYLPTIADSLVAFMTKMKELNGIGSIDFEPLLAAFAAIIGVSFTEFLTAIPNLVSELVNGKSATEQFAEDLINIATSIMAWQAAMDMIGDIEIDGSGIAGLAAVVAGISFAELFTAVTNLVSELVNGKSATEQFREDVENLALSLMEWDVAMTAVGDVDVDFSVIAALASSVSGVSFEGFMTSIGNAVAEFLTGQSGLESFGDNLEELGKCLERWDTATQNLNTESLDATTVAIERLTNIGEKLKSQNLGGMFSESDYSKFGDALKTLGNALVGFSSIQVDATKLAGVSAIAATVISTMGLFSSITIEGNIMDEGLVTTFINNINRLTAAINGLTSLDDSGVSRFKKAVEDISGTDLSGAVSAVADSGKAEMAQGGANAASAYVDSMASTIESSKGAVTSATSSLIDSTSKTIDAASKTFVASGKKITEALASGVRSSSALTGAVQSIVNSASNVSVSSFTSLGRNIIAGIASGINSNSALVANAVAAAVNAGYQEGLRRSQSHSPSRLFMKIGNYIIQGFAKGITDNTDLSRKAADEMVDSTVDQANSAIRRLRDVLSGGVDGDPVIRPVLDLSEIQNGANGIADMLHMNDPIPVLDNFGAISNNSAMIRRRATTDDIMTALASNGGVSSGDTYIIEGITYDDGSNITEAVRTLVHGVKVGRRA